MRLTTDSPENNVETAFNLFYIRDREVFVRGGGPAPDYKDVSLNEYTRQLIRTHAQAEDADVDDEELSMMMAEWVIEGPDTIEGLIATFYTAAWAFSELRECLKRYEDREEREVEVQVKNPPSDDLCASESRKND